ncbi:MAG: hypothetical protein CM1200mP33_6340 [Chloroflexota bacterium]|nr:MAG: hypothetical protein CM1200mP33_6340 [Chloroflexota bacterium]
MGLNRVIVNFHVSKFIDGVGNTEKTGNFSVQIAPVAHQMFFKLLFVVILPNFFCILYYTFIILNIGIIKQISFNNKYYV